jgi:hypothetical protein
MRTIQQILKDIADVATKYANLHMQAMSWCQMWVFNGHKRYHRCKSKEFYNIVLKLKNKSYDYFGVDIRPENSTLSYEPSNILAHFQMWLTSLETDLKLIGNLNKEFFELTGFDAPHVDCMKKIFLKEIEKCKRKITRFKQIGSEAVALHDLHMQDDRLHERMKEVEHDT